MKIRIVKQTNINGRTVRIGDECDASFISPADLRTLLNCECAVIVKEPATVDVADARPATETADNAPTTRRKGKR